MTVRNEEPQPPVSLEDVLITDQLALRPSRPPDHAAENRALAELAQTFAERPGGLLTRLVELILDLCPAESSGVSILEPSGDGFFRWPAVAGTWAEFTGRELPRSDSPCGVVIQQERSLLFDRPGRIFPDVAAVTPPIAEVLLAPFHIEGKPAGTIWAITHSPDRHFDAEDLRLLQSLSRFAAAGYQSLSALEAERETRGRMEQRVSERTAELEAEIERRRVLTRRLATAQEDERRRVSRDLHDSIGQLLAGLSMAFKAVETSGELPPFTAGKVAEAKGIVEALGKEAHGLAVRLRPTSLDDIGLESALGQLVAEWSGRTGVRADFHASGLGPARLTPEIETALYRVVQEALTNVAKHAQASVVSVVVARSDECVTAVIEDDGTGFDSKAAPKGRLGLVGMRERIELVGGDLGVESEPGSGTTIYVRIPIPEGEGGGS